MPRRVVGVLNLDPINHLTVQLATTVNKLGNLKVNSISANLVCDMCVGSHPKVDCPHSNYYASSSLEQVQFFGKSKLDI